MDAVDRVRQHPDLPIVARTHSEAERQYLREHRVDAILAEHESDKLQSRPTMLEAARTAVELAGGKAK